MTIGIFSSKILRIPYLKSFFKEEVINLRQISRWYEINELAGWGYKPFSMPIRVLARAFRMNYIALEDGFIRSFSPGQDNPPLSLIQDQRSIYYHSKIPSELELLLNGKENFTSREKQIAKKAMELMMNNHISKYNDGPLLSKKNKMVFARAKVLIIDQTYKDQSVVLGGASDETFMSMLRQAEKENPNAKIYIKTHPETILGKKHGYLDQIKPGKKRILLNQPINPISLLKNFEHIYVVTSHMGFEALMLGKKVTCFGIPWYAGWGLTDDRQTCLRRKQKRSVEDLFIAAYLRYANYLNPFTFKKGDIFHTIAWIMKQRSVGLLPIQNFISPDLNGRIIAFNFPKWRQFNLKNLLTLYADKFFSIQDYAALLRLNLNKNDSILIWGNEVENELEHAAKKVKFKIIRIEDGFIRSFGLGSDLIAPTSLVFDERVLYFDATKPSTLEVILNKADFKDDDFKMAKKIKNMINHHRISKYNVNVNLRPHWKLTTKKIILVPGQVEDDASIKYGSFWIKRNLELLKEVRQRNPDSWIVYKEHPDIYIKNRKNSLSDKNILKYANYIEVEASIIDCIEASNEVHTMTSLAGFEALLRNKKVITYGEPFYAGWGLTEDLFSQGKCFKRRLRNLDINSLLIGCLLKYPIYWDPCLKGFTSCDASLEVISQKINLAKKRRPVPFFLKKLWSYQNKFTTIYNSYSQQFIR